MSNNIPEIMAPAGSPEVMEAALEAGADSLYFGLEGLNARRGAHNFTLDGLGKTMEQIHQNGAKGYLTLNIDLKQRDLGEACRYLTAAAATGVDAIIARDLALLSLMPYFPTLKFHLSTQAGVSSSDGVLQAQKLGFKRVVLARELTFDEVKACCGQGMEIEVFVQGALCYTMSGHCLLASWGGGRSGNRGLCTSPCRVAWRAGKDNEAQRLFSMNDLCALSYVRQLQEIGVSCFKIEGRLKSPTWVSQAVKLYKRALAGEDIQQLITEAASLGNYGGRTMGAAYLEGKRDCLTGEWARTASTGCSSCENTTPQTKNDVSPAATPVIKLELDFDDRGGANWTAIYGDTQASVRLAASPGTPAKRAVDSQELTEHLIGFSKDFTINTPKIPATYLLPKRHLATLDTFLNNFIRQAKNGQKSKNQILVSPKLLPLYRPEKTTLSGKERLGGPVNLLRLEAQDFEQLAAAYNKMTFIVERATPEKLKKYAKLAPGRVIISLPAIHFEGQQDQLQQLAQECRDNQLLIEVNSLDGLELARKVGFNHFIAGPGLAVLNSLATKSLKDLGATWATISVEADKDQIGELCQYSELPLALTTYSRPVLLVSRATPGHKSLDRLEDARGIVISGREIDGLWTFRPVDPFDIRGVNSQDFLVRYLVQDLCGSREPQKDILSKSSKYSNSFNFFRKLQ